MQRLSTSTHALSGTYLNPLALASGFGVAGVVEIFLFGTAMGAMGAMSGMMGGGVGFFVYALIWGFVGSAVAGGIAALVYNAVIEPIA